MRKKKDEQGKLLKVPSAPTASERFQKLEAKTELLSEQINILAEEIDRLTAILENVTKFNAALLRAADLGTINKTTISQAFLDNAIDKLESVVQKQIEAGTLAVTEEAGERSFLVVRELRDGEIVSRRTQFALPSIDQEIAKEFLSKKVGDSVLLKNGITAEVLNVYSIKELKDVEKKFEEEKVEQQ